MRRLLRSPRILRLGVFTQGPALSLASAVTRIAGEVQVC